MQRSRYFLNVESSACGQAWLDALDIQGINNARAISQKFGFPDQLSRVLSARDVDETEAVAFINPTLRTLMPDPESFVDMQCATERIIKALLNQEQVAVFGDYDVDGACASALIARFSLFWD